jgi:PAS domain S-box-containing protein
MEGILEVLNEGVGITDDTGHVLFVNQCMERLLGAPRAALIGKAADAFYSGKEYEFTLERRARIKGGGYDRYEFFVPHADGTRVPVIISARELEAPDGSPFLVFTCTDISQQKRAEQNLREANAQLKNRADEIDRELAIASRVQESLAPQPLHWGRVAVETFYKPVRTIGGDFGLVIPSDGTHLDLLVCDISGHGISSALLANRIYTETVSLLRHGMEPDEFADSKSLCDRRHQGRWLYFHDERSTTGFQWTPARLCRWGASSGAPSFALRRRSPSRVPQHCSGPTRRGCAGGGYRGIQCVRWRSTDALFRWTD